MIIICLCYNTQIRNGDLNFTLQPTLYSSLMDSTVSQKIVYLKLDIVNSLEGLIHFDTYFFGKIA